MVPGARAPVARSSLSLHPEASAAFHALLWASRASFAAWSAVSTSLVAATRTRTAATRSSTDRSISSRAEAAAVSGSILLSAMPPG